MEISAFDFETKKESGIAPGELSAAMAAGAYCWIDLSPRELPSLREQWPGCRISDELADELAEQTMDGRFDLLDECLHFSLSEGTYGAEEGLRSSVLHVVMCGKAFLTIHDEPLQCIDNMKRTFREDFRSFARSPGFLLYEVGDHLIRSQRAALEGLSEEVEKVQLELFGRVDDAMFRRVSQLITDVLRMRKALMHARELFHQLSVRKSPFIPETTQPALQQFAVTLERIGSDLMAERDVLTESLNLYMGMVGHRTNRVVNRLTVISMIFLPLGFLTGVYGMNFMVMPELAWPFGYAAFWCAAVLVIGTMLLLIRKFRLM